MRKIVDESTIRIRSGFLYTPSATRNSDGVLEKRWMEHATWEETLEWCSGGFYWQKRRWIDE